MYKKIYVSGWHSSTNPSPGPGIGRSLVEGHEDLQVVAVDYSDRSTGLAESFISDRIILPRWKDSNIDVNVRHINSMISGHENTAYISGLDLETCLLASTKISLSGNILVPPKTAISRVLKPAKWLAASLGVQVPESHIFVNFQQAIKFVQRVGWPIFVKGQNYEAKRAANLQELEYCVSYIENVWGGKIILQESIHGIEESVAFAAYRGRILDCCTMHKTLQTTDGKTWNGHITDGASFKASLTKVLSELGWTGGGEIEMIRESRTNNSYLIDFNPRFPAWIYGATIAGINLPSLLIGAHLGISRINLSRKSMEFVRVVHELPATTMRPSGSNFLQIYSSAAQKSHPSGMPELARFSGIKTNIQSTTREIRFPRILQYLNQYLDNSSSEQQADPFTMIMVDDLQERIVELMVGLKKLEEAIDIQIHPAYSVKTNPSGKVLSAVQKAGMGAEAISLSEYQTALRYGFTHEKIVLNGPGKWWSSNSMEPKGLPAPAYVNCNSMDDLCHTLKLIQSIDWQYSSIGIRIRPFGTISRFGIDLSDAMHFSKLAAIIKNTKKRAFGIHFHLASSSIGRSHWQREFEAVCMCAQALESAANIKFSFIDIGGGFDYSTINEYADHAYMAIRIARRWLNHSNKLIIEPGKFLVQQSYCLLARVISVDEETSGRDVVVSAAISDIPDIWTSPHEIWVRRQNDNYWKSVSRGNDRILGRVCMENDIISTNAALPSNICRGDYVAILGVGAYDHSMSYSFGSGFCRDF